MWWRCGSGLGWGGCSWSPPNSWAPPKGLGYLLLDGQQLGKPAQILAAIVIFAILGKTTDWLIEIATAPLLRWQDAFGRETRGRLMLALDRVGKTYPNGVHALDAVFRRDQAGRDRCHHRRFRLRQVNAAPRHCRARSRERGRGDAR